MAVKEYPTEAALAIDLRRFFGFTDVWMKTVPLPNRNYIGP